MASLKELIEAHGIKMQTFYTNTVDHGAYKENDEYDCLLSIRGQVCLYGGENYTRTMLVHGCGQSISQSRRAMHGEEVPPSVFEVLRDALQDANGFDAYDDWQDWAREYEGATGRWAFKTGAHGYAIRINQDEEIHEALRSAFDTGMSAYAAHQSEKRRRDELAEFLGPWYEDFKDAAGNE